MLFLYSIIDIFKYMLIYYVTMELEVNILNEVH